MRLAVDQLAADLGPDAGIVPRDQERAAALDPAEHVHVAAFVFRAAEHVLKGDAAIGRNEQPLAARDDHRGGLAIGHERAIPEQPDISQILPAVTDLEIDRSSSPSANVTELPFLPVS